MDLHGVTGKPYKHPEVRRTIPTFNRPSVNLGGGKPAKRSWKDTSVLKLTVGDTVAQFGTIAEVKEIVSIPGRESLSAPEPSPPTWTIQLFNVMGAQRVYPGHERVYAFTKDLPKTTDE
jgi:hypothetical protein